MTTNDPRTGLLRIIMDRLSARPIDQIRIIDQAVSQLADPSPVLERLLRDRHDENDERENDRRVGWNRGVEHAMAVMLATTPDVIEKMRTQLPSMALVAEFHERFGQVINDEPTVDDDDLSTLRVALLQEELCELQDALIARDPVATLDALADLTYVLNGAYLSLGFHRYKDAAMAEVHRSNLSKLGADGKPVYRADGKVTKGPSYSPPDLETVLYGDDDPFAAESDVYANDDFDSAITGEFTPVAAANNHPRPGYVDFTDRFDTSDTGGEA